jgi:pimeloyl-ACP methyl ester carboxylesterase
MAWIIKSAFLRMDIYQTINIQNERNQIFLHWPVILLLSASNIFAQDTAEKPTIIFVHGIWADGSSWSNKISALQTKGYPVIAVQNPITSLADDV